MGSYRIMRLCLIALLWALFPAIAAAQQVPNPINAPASITSGHAYCATNNPQQSADCGTAPSGGAPIPCVTGNNYSCLDTPNTFTVGPQIFRANGVEVGTPTGGDQGAGTINVDTGFFINGVPLSVGGSSGGANLNQGPLLEVLPNDSGTGTNAGKFAKLNSSGNVRTLTTADTTDGIGICFALTGFTCGTSGNAAIAIGGQVPCFFDGGTTANDWVVASTTTAGDCHDAGSTVPTSVSVLGVALTTNVGAGLYAVDLDPIGLTNAITKRGGGGGGGAPATCALAGNYACTNLAASWAAGQRSTPVAVPLSTSTFTPDMNASDNFTFALVHASCPCQIANPSNLTAGQTGVFVITQSATGGDTVTWGGNYAFPNGTPTLQTTASAEDYFSFYAESSSRIVVVPASGAYGAVQQVVNYNTAAPPTFPSETGFAVNGANSTTAMNAASAFAASAFHTAMRADGTGASPSAVQSGEEIGGTSIRGYNGSTYVEIAKVHGYAAENLAVGHQGSKVCIATTPTASTTPADNLCINADGSVAIPSNSKLGVTFFSIGGCTPSNDGTTPNSVLDIAACQAADSTNAVTMQAAAFTKSTAGAWVAGSGSNGMGNGLTIAASTWYQVCMGNNSGSTDYWFDTSATCANRPSGISDTKYRVIGHFLTDGSAHIVSYACKSVRDCTWAAAAVDINFATIANGTSLKTLTVPLGFKVVAHGEIGATNAAGAVVGDSAVLYDPAGGNPSTGAIVQVSGKFNGGYFDSGTNTSSQVDLTVSSSGSLQIVEKTIGWTEPGLGIDH